MIIHYIKIALRNLWKYKIQNLIGIVGLGLAFVCFAAILYMVRSLWEFDTQYRNADRMYSLKTFIPKDILKNEFPELETIATSIGSGGYRLIEIGGKTIYSKFISADTIHFNLFDLEIASGSRSSITHTKNSFALFEHFANSQTSSPHSLLGTTVIDKEDGKEYTVTGILKNPPINTSLMNEKPIGITFNRYDNNSSSGNDEWANEWLSSYPSDYIIVVNKSFNINDLRKKLEKYHQKYLPDKDKYTNKDFYNVVSNLEFSSYGYQGRLEDKEMIIYFSIVFSIALLILLVALFNYISFLSAQFYNRWRECAIRKVNGASKYQIFFLFYIESVLGILFACGAALLILEIFSPFIQDVYTRISFFPVDFSILRIHILEYVFLVLILALPLCMVPAVIINENSMRFVMMGGNTKGIKMIGRNIFLFLQMLIIVIFMAFSVILMGQLEKKKSVILSSLPVEELDEIISVGCISKYKELWDKADDICKDIAFSPYIRKVTYSDVPVVQDILFSSGFNSGGGFSLPEFDSTFVRSFGIPPHYVSFFEGDILQGCLFDEESDSRDVIINKSFADLFKGENLVGRTFLNPSHKTRDETGEMKEVTYRIIGIVDGLPYAHTIGPRNVLSSQKTPICYTNNYGNSLPGGYVVYAKIIPEKKEDAIRHIEASVRKYLPDGYPLEISTLNNDIDTTLKREIQLSIIFRLLFIISLIIGLLSIYSSVTMNTEKRRKEVAIRKVNGASVLNIILLFCKKYIIIWTVACFVAFPLILYFGNRWLEGYSDRISLGIGFFAGIYFVIFVLIILTIIFQILNVSRCNPADVLKSE